MAGATTTRATEAARRAGVDFTVHDLLRLGRPEPRRDRPELRRESSGGGAYRPDGPAIAELLDVEVERVFKTLVAMVDGCPAVAIVPVGRALDLKALAAARGGHRAAMADPADAERLTGYVVGGISPLGQRRELSTVIDRSAGDHDTVFVSAGRRALELELAPADLVALTRAAMADVAR